METENPKPEVKLAPFLQRNKKKRAHEVFMNFVKYQPRLDVSGVLSKECYKVRVKQLDARALTDPLASTRVKELDARAITE
mmetsp:Transcript_33938/g.41836  ORF Transcript_33938/g.41836 Transcript_33938/m.41836 type:complete len:81 (-) Transcript_33938:681-923(-)